MATVSLHQRPRIRESARADINTMNTRGAERDSERCSAWPKSTAIVSISSLPSRLPQSYPILMPTEATIAHTANRQPPNLIGTLTQYNEGIIGPGHCEDWGCELDAWITARSTRISRRRLPGRFDGRIATWIPYGRLGSHVFGAGRHLRRGERAQGSSRLKLHHQPFPVTAGKSGLA